MKIVKQKTSLKDSPGSIVQVPKDIYNAFDISWLTELLEINTKLIERRKGPFGYPEISVDGCPVIGTGYFSIVYQLVPNMVVKVYGNDIDIRMIEGEMDRAKRAFVGGIPTAIPYGIVRVGNRYGAVFELLKGKRLDKIVAECQDDKGCLDAIIRGYVSCLKNLHGMELKGFQQSKDVFVKKLVELRKFVSKEIILRIKSLLNELPDDFHAVHGDLHLKNIVICNGKYMLIDMDTLNIGQPIFDLQALYLVYKVFGKYQSDSTMRVFGIRQDVADYIWERIMEVYFNIKDRATLNEIEDKIRLVSMISFLFMTVDSKTIEKIVQERRIQIISDEMTKLLRRMTTLFI